jgi:hypothetical protein
MLLALIAIGIAAIVFKFALSNSLENETKKAVLKQLSDEYDPKYNTKSDVYTAGFDVFQVLVS